MDCDSRLTPCERRELEEFAAPLKKSMCDFVLREISADDFEAAFLRSFQQIKGIPSAGVSETLNQIFFAVDDYVGHGMVVNRDEGDIDVGELMTRAREFVALVGWDVAG